MPLDRSRPAALLAACLTLAALAVCLLGCGERDAAPPARYLAITHSALDRVSFFDLDRRRVVGVLPTQKLPHDMLVTADAHTLYVVNSGAQCVSMFNLRSPSLWRQARAFMTRDTSRAAERAGRPHVPANRTLQDDIERHALSAPEFPARAAAVHDSAGALTHTSCTDCHDRSVGSKPFAPAFVNGERAIRMVQLATRDIVELSALSLAVTHRWPLPIAAHYSPIEAWIPPGTDTAFVTCRDSIGRSLPGIVAVVDLASGRLVKTLTPGIFPWHLQPTPDGRQLLVNNFQSSRLAVIDIARQQVVDSIVVENGPAAMLFVDGGRTLLVSCFYTQHVLVVDMATHAVTRRIPVGSNPTQLLATGDGTHVWVLCGGESELQRIDLRAGRVVEHYPLLFGAYAMQLVPPNAKPS